MIFLGADIEGKFSLGRKTAYSLMGAGFHGGTGLKPSHNGHIWAASVVPRLLYRLEALLLKKGTRKTLKDFRGNV